MLSRQRWKPFDVLFGKDDYDLIYVRALLETEERVNNYRDAVEFQKLLGPLAAHSDALAGRGNNGNVHSFTVRFGL